MSALHLNSSNADSISKESFAALKSALNETRSATGDLDPVDWAKFRAQAHIMLDASIDKMESASSGRVWTPVPENMREDFKQGLPVQGSNADERIMQIMPYGVGNTHPRFHAWVHGAGAPCGLLADIASASMNVNAGGRNTISPVIEQQVIAWCLEIMGMPSTGSGLVVSGTSMATVIAIKVARDRAIENARLTGLKQGQYTAYCSNQGHSCIGDAMDMLGFGSEACRKIKVDDNFEMDLNELKSQIAADRAAGLSPLVIVGTAGTVNVGAIDDLETIADIAASEGIWFHVDGAFGAAGCLGQTCKAALSGIARADSLAFDFHKWWQVNYCAGCVLIKDSVAHKKSFASRGDYMRNSSRALASGDWWACDYGPELSRGFSALKVWAHIVEHGIEKLGKTIDRNIASAQHLLARIKSEPKLQSLAPVAFNINVFRYIPLNGDKDSKDELDMAYLSAFTQEIVYRIQESGVSVPSTTLIHNQNCIRVNLTNHRTQNSDLDILVSKVLEIGQTLEKENFALRDSKSRSNSAFDAYN